MISVYPKLRGDWDSYQQRLRINADLQQNTFTKLNTVTVVAEKQTSHTHTHQILI